MLLTTKEDLVVYQNNNNYVYKILKNGVDKITKLHLIIKMFI